MKTTTKIIIAALLLETLLIPSVSFADTPTYTAAQEAACLKQSGSKCEDQSAFGNTQDTMNAELDAAAAQDAEKVCQEKYGTSCQAQADKLRMTSGQGFKLPLDFLTLETKDKNGKVQKQGTSIFYSKDYSKYGVLLGLLLRVIDILIYVIGSVALLTLVVAGIMMIANHGDEGWVTKGKDMMFYSILGVLFALLSFAVVNVVTSIFS